MSSSNTSQEAKGNNGSLGEQLLLQPGFRTLEASRSPAPVMNTTCLLDNAPLMNCADNAPSPGVRLIRYVVPHPVSFSPFFCSG